MLDYYDTDDDVKERPAVFETRYHVVKRNEAGRKVQDIFLTKDKARAEIYQRLYGGEIETIKEKVRR